ncbi:hypothetical protein [Gimesia sp.]|uniref:hypothetical protein n=1 Tax=Gimesia sp. TaxID=2024833 RepID=UPI003A8DF53A
MDWPEISIEDFPPRRDDEPSSLRQDIIDELSDHFACALNRELLKNPDEQLARRRVLEQFGNPIAIARQLWLEAMKEKIMSQRIMNGIFAVMAVCCIAVVGIAWSMMQESRAFNLQLLEQFKLAQERSSAEAPGDMHGILFQLVQEGSEDRPAVGFQGKLTRYEEHKPIFALEVVSDQSGQLDFGKLPWGKYELELQAPWSEKMETLHLITIPGRSYEKTVLCPARAPQKVDVQFQVNWQNKPVDQEYYLLCDFRSLVYTPEPWQGDKFHFSTRKKLQNRFWSVEHNPKQEGVYLIDVNQNRATSCPLAADGSIEKFDVQKLVWQPTVEILEGQYFTPTIYLIEKNKLEQLADLNSSDSALVARIEKNRLKLILISLPGPGLIVDPFHNLEIDPALVVDESPSELKAVHGFYPETNHVPHTVSRDQSNVWKIDIPNLFPISRESDSLSSAL